MYIYMNIYVSTYIHTYIHLPSATRLGLLDTTADACVGLWLDQPRLGGVAQLFIYLYKSGESEVYSYMRTISPRLASACSTPHPTQALALGSTSHGSAALPSPAGLKLSVIWRSSGCIVARPLDTYLRVKC